MNRPEPRRLVVGITSLLLAVVVLTGLDSAGVGWLVPFTLVFGGAALLLGRSPRDP